MSKFKVGDKVRVISDSQGSWNHPYMDYLLNSRQIVVDVDDYSGDVLIKNTNKDYTTICQWTLRESAVELINEGEEIMSETTNQAADLVIKEKLSADDYTLYKANILEVDGSLTSDGARLLQRVTLNKYKSDLLAMVEPESTDTASK